MVRKKYWKTILILISLCISEADHKLIDVPNMKRRSEIWIKKEKNFLKNKKNY